jgi:hypothetical protein
MGCRGGDASTNTSSSGSSDSACPAAAPLTAWRWVARANAAAAHPTDFALVELLTPGLAAVAAVEALLGRRLGGAFRDVHPDRRFAGKLKGFVPHAADDGGSSGRSSSSSSRGGSSGRTRSSSSSSSSGGGVSRRKLNQNSPSPAAPASAPPPAPGPLDGWPDDDILTTTKPPGRFRTRPTIGLTRPGDEGDDGAGTSAAGARASFTSDGGQELKKRRRLQAVRRRVQQREQLADGPSADHVTVLLNASRIWAQGFTGKGVKVRGGAAGWWVE